MKEIHYIVFAATLFFGCERSVIIESPYPAKAAYCNADSALIGDWESDSVWVLTQSDSLDSTIINTRPTYFYDLQIDCDADTTFLLEYINFSGVRTQEFYSRNFEVMDSSIVLYGELDFEREGKDSVGELQYFLPSDSTIFLRYTQRLNSDQFNEIRIWLSR